MKLFKIQNAQPIWQFFLVGEGRGELYKTVRVGINSAKFSTQQWLYVHRHFWNSIWTYQYNHLMYTKLFNLVWTVSITPHMYAYLQESIWLMDRPHWPWHWNTIPIYTCSSTLQQGKNSSQYFDPKCKMT